MAKRSGSAKSCGGKKVKVECSPVCGVSDISADAHATVHGIVVSVSLKRKGGHFEGELNDGVAIVRVVGFEEKQHEMLVSHIGQREYEDATCKNLCGRAVRWWCCVIAKHNLAHIAIEWRCCSRASLRLKRVRQRWTLKIIATVGADVICLKELPEKED